MRSIIDFYKQRPVVGVVVFVIGLVVAIATTSLKKGDGVILPVAFVIAIGFLVGSVVAYGQRRRRAEEDLELERAFADADADAMDPRR
jgi:uncharacterized membrane protein